jgi:hypothetical protein
VDVSIREDSPAADAGTAAHLLLATLVETGVAPWDDVADVAKAHGCDPDELRMLLACGVRLWRDVAPSFVNARTELQADLTHGALTLTGHMDLVAIATASARVADFKTGRKDSDYSAQLRGYAALVFAAWPELEEVTATALWVRDGEIENYTITRAQNEAWLDQVERTLTTWDGAYHPAPARCLYCRRAHECQGRTALVRREVSAIAATDAEGLDLAAMPPEAVIDLVERAAMVAKLAERLRAAVKEHVQLAGDVVAADGRRLTVVQEPRREVDALAAWPVLEAQGFQDEDFAACMKLSVSALEKRVATKAGRGKGAAATRALNEALNAAHAIRTKTTEKLTTKRG